MKFNPPLPAITGSGILEAEAGNHSSNDIPQLDGSDDIDEILSANEKKVDELAQINLDEIDEARYQRIPQLDGFEDIGEKQVEKTVFGVNCANDQIIQIINFFRSFNLLWISRTSHSLCSLDKSCFFCNMRSACLRLRQCRQRAS